MASDGGGNTRAECSKILILLGFIGIRTGLLNDLGEHSFECRAFQAHRCSFYRKCLRAKGFHLKAVAVQLFGDLGKNHHLPGLQFHQEGHQQALALHLFHLAIAQNFFKKHSLVCHMLVDYPQAVVAGGQNERLAQLAQRAQGAQMIEVGGGLFGFNLGGLLGRSRRVS